MFAALGAWLGMTAGQPIGFEVLGGALGAGAGAGSLALIDGLRARVWLRWLSVNSSEDAPPLAGLWGEVGLRSERALRLRDREIRREQDRLAEFLTAIEASPNGVVMLDASEQIEWCSGMAAEHLGLDVQRDRQQRITNLVRAPAFVSHLHSHNFELPVLIPGPRGRGSISIIVRPYGEGQRLLLTQDVTARERDDATRRDFVANVSHEIRTPLTVLSGFVETMASLPLTEVERTRVLSMMGAQTRRMQALVGDLLVLARLEGSPRPLADAWVPIEQMGAAVEADALGLSAGRHALSFDWGPGLQLAGAEAELQSAVGNLVNNAVRYTPEGGSVTVTTHLRSDGAAEIRVVDTGPGIAPEHLPRLTERFYRVDGSRSRDTGGTGLGLSIVKHVAQRHGGELKISSEIGRGSCFTIVVPAARVRQRSTADATAA
ncbi:phosphate regulon sensor histidine kinase PhoR [Ideonella sp.]|uniref:phosphate regulon sensor histidine kinase PhoR n=1 Tax=Ideonella sp. TaxID=1929293 RepID=UPI003BB52373